MRTLSMSPHQVAIGAIAVAILDIGDKGDNGFKFCNIVGVGNDPGGGLRARGDDSHLTGDTVGALNSDETVVRGEGSKIWRDTDDCETAVGPIALDGGTEMGAGHIQT